MIKLKELEEWLLDLQYLIVDIEICVSNGQRIPNNIYPEEDKLKRFGFFSYYQFHLTFIAGIQLSKILSDSDNHKRNIHKLFRRLESESCDSKLKNTLKINNSDKEGRKELMADIAGFRKLLLNKKKLINRVTEVRDKAFAHHDLKKNELGLSFLEYQELLDLTLVIWNRLKLKTLGSSIVFDLSTVSIDPIIRHAAKSYSSMIDKRKK